MYIKPYLQGWGDALAQRTNPPCPKNHKNYSFSLYTLLNCNKISAEAGVRTPAFYQCVPRDLLGLDTVHMWFESVFSLLKHYEGK